jgi:hypothetical protein
MFDQIINYITLVAFCALITDNIIQSYHIIKGHSSMDISLRGEAIRLFAVTILFIKFMIVRDLYLIVGQGIFGVTLLIYYILLIKYHHPAFKK